MLPKRNHCSRKTEIERWDMINNKIRQNNNLPRCIYLDMNVFFIQDHWISFNKLSKQGNICVNLVHYNV